METTTQVGLKANSYRRLYKERNFSDSENIECFKLFNPETKDKYDFITNNWRKVNY
jgi:hypothetical protein